jgi:hypothetical protein
MGNGESTYDDSQSDPPYAGSSTDTFYQHMHQTTSIADDSHDDMQIHPPSYAGSSTDTHYRLKQKSTCIADHFTSLDQVFTVPLT